MADNHGSRSMGTSDAGAHADRSFWLTLNLEALRRYRYSGGTSCPRALVSIVESATEVAIQRVANFRNHSISAAQSPLGRETGSAGVETGKFSASCFGSPQLSVTYRDGCGVRTRRETAHEKPEELLESQETCNPSWSVDV